jgi:hypothetical protein
MADENVALVKALKSRSSIQNRHCDSDLVVPGYEGHIAGAITERNAYSDSLSALMHQYGLQDEYETVLGDVWFENKSERREWQGLREGLEAQLSCLHKSFRDKFFQGIEGDPAEQRRKASAWYSVTYNKAYDGGKVMLNFPWIVTDILCQIKVAQKVCTDSCK